MNSTYAIQTDRYSRQTRLRRLCILTILAAIFSFLGWLAETVLFMMVRGEFVDRGLLIMPFCPMYGISLIVVYAILRTPCSGIWAKLTDAPHTRTGKFAAALLCLLLYAAAAALLASVSEYVTGIVYERGFGIRLWNYHNDSNNLHGYVCLKYSLVWGGLAVGVMGLVWYPLQNLLARAKTAVLVIAAAVLFTSLSADFIFNMVYLYINGVRFLPF